MNNNRLAEACMLGMKSPCPSRQQHVRTRSIHQFTFGAYVCCTEEFPENILREYTHLTGCEDSASSNSSHFSNSTNSSTTPMSDSAHTKIDSQALESFHRRHLRPISTCGWFPGSTLQVLCDKFFKNPLLLSLQQTIASRTSANR
jgi:hypothetical protein